MFGGRHKRTLKAVLAGVQVELDRLGKPPYFGIDEDPTTVFSVISKIQGSITAGNMIYHKPCTKFDILCAKDKDNFR